MHVHNNEAIVTPYMYKTVKVIAYEYSNVKATHSESNITYNCSYYMLVVALTFPVLMSRT